MSNNELITDFSLIKGKKCMICCDSFSSKDSENFNVIRLKCGHLFKYNHLYLSAKVQNNNLWGYKKCPYCMKSYGKLPFKIKKTI